MADLTLRGQSEEALARLRAGRPREALAIARRILQTFNKHVGTYGIVAQAYLALGEHELAAAFFRRVLSVDPEHVLSYISMAAIHEARGSKEEAMWHLERAYELAPSNAEVRQKLNHLYIERSILPTARAKMTRAALARTYLRGQLYGAAIKELRELARADPMRFDLRVALAEALWRDGRVEDAAVVCQGILHELPNCLKANLILGQLWLNTDQDESARIFLQRAQTLDPDNVAAQALFGARSPLPPRTARLPFRVEDAPPVELPYLVDDEGLVESVVIEGQANMLPDTPQDEDASRQETATDSPEAPTEQELSPSGDQA